MYLHLGQDVVVRHRDILGIFDLDNCSVSKITRAYLTAAQKNNGVVTVTAELPKSFVVTEEAGKVMVYISQISAGTLRKRYGSLNI